MKFHITPENHHELISHEFATQTAQMISMVITYDREEDKKKNVGKSDRLIYGGQGVAFLGLSENCPFPSMDLCVKYSWEAESMDTDNHTVAIMDMWIYDPDDIPQEVNDYEKDRIENGGILSTPQDVEILNKQLNAQKEDRSTSIPSETWLNCKLTD